MTVFPDSVWHQTCWYTRPVSAFGSLRHKDHTTCVNDSRQTTWLLLLLFFSLCLYILQYDFAHVYEIMHKWQPKTSLNVKLGWQPVKPRNPSPPSPFLQSLELQACTWAHLPFYVGVGIQTQVFNFERQALSLIEPFSRPMALILKGAAFRLYKENSVPFHCCVVFQCIDKF